MSNNVEKKQNLLSKVMILQSCDNEAIHQKLCTAILARNLSAKRPSSGAGLWKSIQNRRDWGSTISNECKNIITVFQFVKDNRSKVDCWFALTIDGRVIPNLREERWAKDKSFENRKQHDRSSLNSLKRLLIWESLLLSRKTYIFKKICSGFLIHSRFLKILQARHLRPRADFCLFGDCKGLMNSKLGNRQIPDP